MYFVMQSTHTGWACATSTRLSPTSRRCAAQMARGTEFRGYGPITVAATGVLALLAAGAQAILIPEPAASTSSAISRLWVATAAASVVLIGDRDGRRAPRRIHTGLADEMIHGATEQFIPAGVAGTLLTVVLYRVRTRRACGCCPASGRSCSASASSPPAARCRARCSRSASGISPPGLASARLRQWRAGVLALGDGAAVRRSGSS